MILFKALPPAYNEVVSSSKEYKCQHHDGKQHPRYPNRNLQTPEGVHFLGPEGGTCDQTDIPQVLKTKPIRDSFCYHTYNTFIVNF